MARTAEPLRLTADQRAEVMALSQSPRVRLAQRAAIVLAVSEEGMTHTAVAQELGTVEATVRRWRRRFEAEGLAGLQDAPRSPHTRHGSTSWNASSACSRSTP